MQPTPSDSSIVLLTYIYLHLFTFSYIYLYSGVNVKHDTVCYLCYTCPYSGQNFGVFPLE